MKPTERQISVLRKQELCEKGEDVFINKADREECIDRGWIEPGLDGFCLTNEGKNVLKLSV